MKTIDEIISDNINRVEFPFIDEWIEDKNAKVETIKILMQQYCMEVLGEILDNTEHDPNETHQTVQLKYLELKNYLQGE